MSALPKGKVYHPSQMAGSSSRADFASKLEHAKKTYTEGKALRKYAKRYQQIIDLMDDYKRPGTLVDLGIEGAKALIERHVGSIAKHPYWAFHQVHFKVLAAAVRGLGGATQITRSADAIVKAITTARASHDTVLARVGKSQKAYRSMVDDSGAVFVGASFLRMMISDEGRRQARTAATMKSAFALWGQTSRFYKRNEALVDEMASHYVAIAQQRDFIIQANKIISETRKKMEGKNVVETTYGRVADYSASLAYASDDVGFDLASQVAEYDAMLAEVQRIAAEWTGFLDQFSQKMLELDVFAGLRPQ